jgi:hypothetical protein
LGFGGKDDAVLNWAGGRQGGVKEVNWAMHPGTV